MMATTFPAAVGFLFRASDDAAEWPLLLILAGVALALAALAAHAAASLLEYSPTKLGRLPKAIRKGIVEDLQQHEREYQLTAWLIMLVSLFAAVTLTDRAAAAGVGWPLVVAGGLVSAYVCAALPVALAHRRPEAVVLMTLPVLRVFRMPLRHVLAKPLAAAARALLRAVRITDREAADRDKIADDILAAVTDSAQENALEEEERHWIENIVELKDQRVTEAMTPRTDIEAFDAELPLLDAVRRAIETGHSRYPVYEGKVDRVIGVFYAKDALARLSNGGDRNVPVREVMRKPLFVPETMGVRELLAIFKARKLQMAIVLDEYGGTAGLISIEDILEEIVGDIEDEFDPDEESPIRVITESRVVEISGRARVDEVNEKLEDALPEDDEYDTVAGFVFTHLGRIPRQGDSFRIGSLDFEILRADDRRIDRMRVTLLEPAVES